MNLKHIPLIGFTVLGGCENTNNNYPYPTGLEVESIISCQKGDREILHIGQTHTIGQYTLGLGEEILNEIKTSQNQIYKTLTVSLEQGNSTKLTVAMEGLEYTPKTQQEVSELLERDLNNISGTNLSNVSYGQGNIANRFNLRYNLLPLTSGTIRCANEGNCKMLVSESTSLNDRIDQDEARINQTYRDMFTKISYSMSLSEKEKRTCLASIEQQLSNISYSSSFKLDLDQTCSAIVEKEVKNLEELYKRTSDLVIKQREDYALNRIDFNWANFKKQKVAPIVFGEMHDFKDNVEEWNKDNPEARFCLSRIY